MKSFDALLELAKRKSDFDQDNAWFKGSSTYLDAIKKEVDEVIEEIPKSRNNYLEDELADVLWNTLNSLLALEKETGICTISVLERAVKKYRQRMAGIEAGVSWEEIKNEQKQALAAETPVND
ncbi:MazG nucleotide pyrophosphohydrolase domain-containing protein [Motilimonas sp. 1_MG-2023]|uniref:MazG nucleotide pyrophosphohydrolase domain-containing protein n=1 Tax=Motilimonas TaxID=1914248 RepID=UPI0026E44846|nr:MazG nucleotide pyrophosphohydrolase domain-containing protein [Motilimonas sp. 1_MG-2023]MDO6526900.1 MazG nucleotide pyrophosphohydrolase domain-containing protein [Motilimonas sp. 1_MG-2023]